MQAGVGAMTVLLGYQCSHHHDGSMWKLTSLGVHISMLILSWNIAQNYMNSSGTGNVSITVSLIWVSDKICSGSTLKWQCANECQLLTIGIRYKEGLEGVVGKGSRGSNR